MSKLANDETLIKQLRSNARSSVLNTFSRINVWQELEIEYKSLLDQFV
jgi:hypothetical protein